MAKPEKSFKKLPGRLFSLFGIKRLYEGSDHLLWVETIMGQEHYRRFYYKDIQAIVLQRTRVHHFWSVAWSLPALLFGILSLAASGPAYVSTFLCIFFLICLGLNLIFGSSCTIYLQTAVQLQQITLGRLYKARRVVDRLKDRIEREQGRFDVTAASTQPAKAYPSPGALHAIRPEHPSKTASGIAEAAEPEPFNPVFHILLFSVLIAAGIGRISQYATGWLALGFLDLFLIAAGLVLAAVALVRFHRQLKGRWLGHGTWTALIFFILHGFTDYVFYIIAIVRNPDVTMNHWELLKRFMETLMDSHPAILGIQLGSAAISLVLGVSGFLALRRN